VLVMRTFPVLAPHLLAMSITPHAASRFYKLWRTHLARLVKVFFKELVGMPHILICIWTCADSHAHMLAHNCTHLHTERKAEGTGSNQFLLVLTRNIVNTVRALQPEPGDVAARAELLRLVTRAAVSALPEYRNRMQASGNK